ncbi:DUF2850 domain-containing protein [Vibrio taketomensis]|uniref:DUF2850 domain-containing protein n=1 Tax=Vibrio taketomensis TaxID=2572923 RepID=UPI0013899F3E|nr:DUF2850 domain-containing protein [Vibrio taketomensis]
MSLTVKGKMSQSQPYSKKRKGLEALAWLGAIVTTYFIFQGCVLLHEKYQRFTHPNSLIYGVWIEHDVASYQAERIVINEHGVIVNGGVVDTDFEFDGDYLVYQHGTQERRFKFQYENWDQMTLQTQFGYKPVFIKSSVGGL